MLNVVIDVVITVVAWVAWGIALLAFVFIPIVVLSTLSAMLKDWAAKLAQGQRNRAAWKEFAREQSARGVPVVYQESLRMLRSPGQLFHESN